MAKQSISTKTKLNITKNINWGEIINIDTVEKATHLTNRKSQQIARVNMKMREPLVLESDTFTRLKLKINNLLWEELPGLTTIAQAETIACNIMSSIVEEQN